MEIKIKKTGIATIKGDPGAADVTHAYRVVDRGREFHITFTSHRHGHSVGIAGEKGTLYIDGEEDTVRRQVFDVGLGCGVGIASDEPVEGLSPWSVRVVVLAHRAKEEREITLVMGESGSERPAVFVDGEAADR